jgi:hypothetical protein
MGGQRPEIGAHHLHRRLGPRTRPRRRARGYRTTRSRDQQPGNDDQLKAATPSDHCHAASLTRARWPVFVEPAVVSSSGGPLVCEIARMAADLDQRAVAAAGAVAAANGLTPDEATVIYSGSNVLVHLRPAPVVARVMTGTVALHDRPRRWLEREISVLEFLAPSRLAIAPSRLIAPGPYHHDGLWMTFSEWVADVEPATRLDDPRRLGVALRDLHDELRPFDGDLGSLCDLREDIERLHGQLQPADAEETDSVAAVRARLDALRQVVFESTHPTQALHGDVSLSNLLRTPDRLVWNDFEDTFRGPVHWDVAGYVISLTSHGASSGFVRRMLDAYRWVDTEELRPFFTAHGVYDEIWRLYDRQRRHSPSRRIT